MWIATKFDEALPAIYFTVGAALIAGSLYIGLDSEAVLAYFILGSMCIGCSTVISDLRHRTLSVEDRSRT